MRKAPTRLVEFAGLNTLLFTPEPATDPDKGLPLIVFLHGNGEAGDSLTEESLKKLEKTGLPRVIKDGPPLVHGREFPFLVAAPQAPRIKDQKYMWAHHTKRRRILDLVEELIEVHGADRSRCYLTGISNGAHAVWENAALGPDRFAALVAVSGGCPAKAIKKSKEIRAWVFSGKKDHWPNIREAPPKIMAIRKDGAETRVTEEDEGHDQAFWNKIYARPELYEWLLKPGG